MEFFQLKTIPEVLALYDHFPVLGTEIVPLTAAWQRVLAEDIAASQDVPAFDRAVMDGYAVRARDTFGASPSSPAWLTIVGEVAMGQAVDQTLGPGQVMRISTGGMLPLGADAVVMVEYTQELGDQTLEVYRSVAPWENVVQRGEDVQTGAVLLTAGSRLRPQDIGLLAAMGIATVPVYRRPRVALIATGDEIVPLTAEPQAGQMRDANSFALAAQVQAAGGLPLLLGIIPDQLAAWQKTIAAALEQADLILLAGGSSVGTRDLAVTAIQTFPASEILVHGVAISPGKPTILAGLSGTPLVGLPGHPVSAMIIMDILVKPLLARLQGQSAGSPPWYRTVTAQLSRNLASTPGREEFIRVRLRLEGETLWADPILGQSGLISTMVKADGLVQIPLHTEGLEQGALVQVRLFDR